MPRFTGLQYLEKNKDRIIICECDAFVSQLVNHLLLEVFGNDAFTDINSVIAGLRWVVDDETIKDEVIIAEWLDSDYKILTTNWSLERTKNACPNATGIIIYKFNEKYEYVTYPF